MRNPKAVRFLIPLCASLLLLLTLALATTDPGDAAAMAALAKSLTPLPSKWATLPNPDPCGARWEGVSCASGKVTSIDLKGMSLQGQIPPEIAQLSSLQSLSLQNNHLNGNLPSLEGMANLRQLYLGNNGFQSLPPTFFSGLTSLLNVSLDGNPFSPWTLPNDLSQCTDLRYFSAMNATIVGAMPDLFGALASLQMLRLSYNYLVGGLPSSLSSSSIRELYLNNQLQNSTTAMGKLSGSLDVLGSMTQLSVAWLHVNSFSGSIPDLSKCTSLVDLQLRDNQLTGVLPSSLASLPNLRTLTLSNNLLQGPVPSLGKGVAVETSPGNSFCNPQPQACDQRVTDLLSIAAGVGYPASLARAWKGNNPCNGWLFVTCDPQGSIASLSFVGQNLVGNISDAVANFRSLKFLRLQNNSLTGVIPPGLAALAQLQLIDVSYNNLSGDVPNFGPNVKVITIGNPLLGSHTGSGGNGGSTPASGGNSASSSGGRTSSLSIGYIVLIVLVVVAVIVTLVGFFLFKRWKNRLICCPPPDREEIVKLGMAGLNGNGNFTVEFDSQNSTEYGNAHVIETRSMYVPIQDLQQATNNFSEGNILGRGGFGVVYKGEQPDGTLIAVKRMECSGMGKKGMGEFKAEIEVLKKVRHRHLVALLGYCEHGNEKLLVYEYMPQGTLAQHLFRGKEMNYSPLSWKQRLTIALDVARGLEYLHSLAQTSFIHRDLKPSNILLDNDMRAKVSDFGLVKLAPDEYSMETRLAGTFGYLAPEYATTGRVTTKIDVYAFGVVLMELITGRKALDESLADESSHLVSWFRRVLINKDRITKAVDPNLDLNDEDCKSLVTVAELAGHCTSREAHQRPDMGHAVSVLVPLVGQWKPIFSDEEDNNVGSKETLSQRVRRWQQDEGTSTTIGFDSDSHYDMENTQGSIPTKPDAFPDGR